MFLLHAEDLSSLISQIEEHKPLNGFACTLNIPCISHLIFADDSLVFSCAIMDDYNTVLTKLQ